MRGGRHPLPLRAAAHVSCERESRATSLAQGLRSSLHTCRVDVHENHFHAQSCEAASDGEADTGGGAGNDGNAAGDDGRVSHGAKHGERRDV